MEQRAEGTLRIWMEPLTVLRTPQAFNLRTDTSERTDITSHVLRLVHEQGVSTRLEKAAGWTVVGRHGRNEFALPPMPVRGRVTLALVRTDH